MHQRDQIKSKCLDWNYKIFNANVLNTDDNVFKKKFSLFPKWNACNNNTILAVRSQKQWKNLLPWLMCCCCFFFSFRECYNGIHGAHTLIVNVFVNIIPTTKNYTYSSKHVVMSPTVLNCTAQKSDRRLSQNKRLWKTKHEQIRIKTTRKW